MEEPTASELEPVVPRQFQLELLAKAQRQNTVAVLDTGAGKTLIAALLVSGYTSSYHLLPVLSQPLVLFVVPQIHLVPQQAAVLESYCGVKVAQVSGEHRPHDISRNARLSDRRTWQTILSSYRVLVMTGQVLLDALRHGFLSLERVSLLILDECHHATYGHPYNRIMSEFYGAMPPLLRPRIFGMTASPCKVRDPRALRAEIEMLEQNMDSSVETSVLFADEVSRCIPLPAERAVLYKSCAVADSRWCDRVELCVAQMEEQLLNRSGRTFYVLDLRRLKACLLDALDLARSQHFFLAHILLRDFIDMHVKLRHSLFRQWCSLRRTAEEQTVLSDLESLLLSLLPSLSEDAATLGHILEGDKLFQLNTVLAGTRDDHPSTLIFVHRRCTARAVASYLRVPCITGENAAANREPLAAFRKGSINILVATAVGEEGLHVGSCSLVIRFDIAGTLIEHIQSRGRARARNALHVVLVPDGDIDMYSHLCDLRSMEATMRTLISVQSTTSSRSMVDDANLPHIMDGVMWDSMPRSFFEQLRGRFCRFSHETFYKTHLGAKCSLHGASSIVHEVLSLGRGRSVFLNVMPPQELETVYDTRRKAMVTSVSMTVGGVPIKGPFCGGVTRARNYALLFAVAVLHTRGELDDYLCPVRKRYLQSKDVPLSSDSDSADDDDAEGGIAEGGKHVGGVKMRQRTRKAPKVDEAWMTFPAQLADTPPMVQESQIWFVLHVTPLVGLLVPRLLCSSNSDAFSCKVSTVTLNHDSFCSAAYVSEVFARWIAGHDVPMGLSTPKGQSLMQHILSQIAASSHGKRPRVDDFYSTKWRHIYWYPCNRIRDVLLDIRDRAQSVSILSPDLAVPLLGVDVTSGQPLLFSHVDPDATPDDRYPNRKRAKTYRSYYASLFPSLTDEDIQSRMPKHLIACSALPSLHYSSANAAAAADMEKASAGAAAASTVSSRAALQNVSWRQFSRQFPDLLLVLPISLEEFRAHVQPLPLLLFEVVELYAADFAAESLRLTEHVKLRTLVQAFTLSRYRLPDYNRLEFLGDSCLKWTATHSIYASQPQWAQDRGISEGYLSMHRERVISNRNLRKIALQAGLCGHAFTLHGVKRLFQAVGDKTRTYFFKNDGSRQGPEQQEKQGSELPVMSQGDSSSSIEKTTENEKGLEDKDKDSAKHIESDEEQDTSVSSLVTVSRKTTADLVESVLGCIVASAPDPLSALGSLPVLMKSLGFALDTQKLDPRFELACASNSVPSSSSTSVAAVDRARARLSAAGIYTFRRASLLLEALTHPSYAFALPSCSARSYDQLEFVGDALVDVCVTLALWHTHTTADPGMLTNARSVVVCNANLARRTVRLGLASCVLLMAPQLEQVIARFVGDVEAESDDALWMLFSNSVAAKQEKEKEKEKARELKLHPSGVEDFVLNQKHLQSLSGVGDQDEVDSLAGPKVLADVFEAIVGAVWLDCGRDLHVTAGVVERMLGSTLEQVKNNIWAGQLLH